MNNIQRRVKKEWKAGGKMGDFRFPYSWDRSSPVQILATFIWNCCERFNINFKYSPQLFNIIIFQKGVKINEKTKK